MRTLQFHQKFAFDRARLATLVRCIAEQGTSSKKAAAAYMGMGEPAAEGFCGWLVKTGLGRSERGAYSLTSLGQLVAAHDIELEQPNTLWLLHYALVSEHAERAEVWYRAFNEFLNPGMRFMRNELQTYVERSLEQTPTNKAAVGEDSKRLLSSYTQPTALAKLDLMREAAKDTYEAGMTQVPDPQIFAFALFDAWQRRFPHADTLRVTQICQEPELPGKVFVARRDQVLQLLQALHSLGLVNLVESQHEPVTRRFRGSPLQLLESFYSAQ